jgi:hypothetical protein
MKHLTRAWWVCLSDRFGNVSHRTLGDFLAGNRRDVVNGTATGPVAVALAASLDQSQDAGRVVRGEIRAAKMERNFAVAEENRGNDER